MSRLILSALALGAVLTSTAPAFAQKQVSVHVQYGDLNLASGAGVQAFHERIEAAVADICGAVDPRDLPVVKEVQACRSVTEASAAKVEREAVAEANQTVLASATPVR